MVMIAEMPKCKPKFDLMAWKWESANTTSSDKSQTVIIDLSVPNNYGEFRPKVIENPGWFKAAIQQMGWRLFRGKRR